MQFTAQDLLIQRVFRYTMLLFKLVFFSFKFLSLEFSSNNRLHFLLNRHFGSFWRIFILKFFSLISVPSFLTNDILEIAVGSKYQEIKEETTNENLNYCTDDSPHHYGGDGVVTSD